MKFYIIIGDEGSCSDVEIHGIFIDRNRATEFLRELIKTNMDVNAPWRIHTEASPGFDYLFRGSLPITLEWWERDWADYIGEPPSYSEEDVLDNLTLIEYEVRGEGGGVK